VRIRTKLALMAGDLLLFSLCLLGATYLQCRELEPLFGQYSTIWVLSLTIYPLCLYITRSYELQPEASSAENLRRSVLGLLAAASTISLVFCFGLEFRFSRGIFGVANIIFIFVLPLWRLGVFLHLRRRSLSVLLMGNATAVEMARHFIREFSPSSRTQVWQPREEAEGASIHTDPQDAHFNRSHIDLLILAGHSLAPPTLRKAAALRLEGVIVWDLPRLWSEFAERLPAGYIDEGWIATAEGFRSLNGQGFQVTKRLLDISLAFILLLINLPVLALAAILIKFGDRGSLLYHQERVGKGGKAFCIHKLRTMVGQAEDVTGPVWASPDDPRVTLVGRWLRKLRIDEIPQMWNVLKGEMSFVGPRPERRVFVEALQSKFPVYSLRHLVRPGVTGWAQVHCPYAASEEETLLKLEYDLYYLQNASLLFDIRIILKTIRIVASLWGSW